MIIGSVDAYLDHPSFGHAVMGLLPEKEGFRLVILPKPNWRDDLRGFNNSG